MIYASFFCFFMSMMLMAILVMSVKETQLKTKETHEYAQTSEDIETYYTIPQIKKLLDKTIS